MISTELAVAVLLLTTLLVLALITVFNRLYEALRLRRLGAITERYLGWDGRLEINLSMIVAAMLSGAVMGPSVLAIVDGRSSPLAEGLATLSNWAVVMVFAFAGSHTHLEMLRHGEEGQSTADKLKDLLLGPAELLIASALLFAPALALSWILPGFVASDGSAVQAALLVSLMLAAGSVVITTQLYQEHRLTISDWTGEALFHLAINQIGVIVLAAVVLGGSEAGSPAVLLVGTLGGSAFAVYSGRWVVGQLLRLVARYVSRNAVVALALFLGLSMLGAAVTGALGLTRFLGAFLVGMMFAPHQKELNEQVKKGSEVYLRAGFILVYFSVLFVRHDFLSLLGFETLLLFGFFLGGSLLAKRTAIRLFGAWREMLPAKTRFMQTALTPLGVASMALGDQAVAQGLLEPGVLLAAGGSVALTTALASTQLLQQRGEGEQITLADVEVVYLPEVEVESVDDFFDKLGERASLVSGASPSSIRAGLDRVRAEVNIAVGQGAVLPHSRPAKANQGVIILARVPARPGSIRRSLTSQAHDGREVTSCVFYVCPSGAAGEATMKLLGRLSRALELNLIQPIIERGGEPGELHDLLEEIVSGEGALEAPNGG